MSNPLIQNLSHSVDSTPPGRQLFRFGLVLLQVGLLWWLIGRYAVEDNLGVIQLMPVVFFGFLIHSLLPQKLRIHFFVLLGIAGAFALLNAWQALTLLGLATLLFGICNLPLAVRYRALLLIAAGGLLAWLWGWQKGSIPDDYLIVPIVGSLFMFRASVYLYDQQFEKERPSLSHRIAYFLMLPNLVFTLFAVVDYKIFKQTYYADEPLAIYQKGIRWMVRGFFHLMLYRIIYYFFLPSFDEVSDLWSFTYFAVTNYLLILRLSGLFHFGVGALCLFGWNLPPVFNNYFLASGFSDLWRRINVYFRDYIMKVFYYPVYFRLRKMGKTLGMVLSIWIIFIITWLLHSYQWFWLKGSFPLRTIDALFWGIFGILVSINAVVQQRSPKKKAGVGGFQHTLLKVSQIVGMFVFMCLLWSFWTSPTLTDWLSGVSVVGTASPGDWMKLLGLLAGLILTGSLVYSLLTKKKVQEVLEPAPGSWGSVLWSFCTMLPFVLFLSTDIQQALDGFTNKPIAHLTENRLNAQDREQMVNGYYEDILITNNLVTPLADLQQRPAHWKSFPKINARKATRDWRNSELVPAISTTFKGYRFSTNRWAMRDRDYERLKPANTIRLGIVGGSYVAGSGVNDHEVFDELAENEFNRRKSLEKKLELLNFSIPGYHLLHCMYRFEHKAIDFDLDGLLLVTHSVDLNRLSKTLLRIGEFLNSENEGMPFPFLEPYFKDDSLNISLSDKKILFREQLPMLKRILTQSYEYLASKCAEKGIQPILVYWPRTRKDAEEGYEFVIETAKAAGFRYIDLSEAYGNLKKEEITVARWDQHPNKLAHRKIADLLLQKLNTQPDIVRWLKSIE